MPNRMFEVTMGDFLLHEISGEMDLEAALQNLSELNEQACRNPRLNILSDIRHAHFNLSPSEVRTFAEAVFSTPIGVNSRCALLHCHRDAFDRPRFLEFLAREEGRRIKVCEDFEEAFQWLSERHPSQFREQTVAA